MVAFRATLAQLGSFLIQKFLRGVYKNATFDIMLIVQVLSLLSSLAYKFDVPFHIVKALA